MGVMPIPPPIRIERRAPAASGNRFRGEPIRTHEPAWKLAWIAAEPPRDAGSSRMPSLYMRVSAGSPQSEYCRISPGETSTSTCAPGSNGGKLSPPGSTRSRTTLPCACSSRRATTRSSLSSRSASKTSSKTWPKTWPKALSTTPVAATGSEDITDATERFRRVDEANDFLIDLERSRIANQPIGHVRGVGPRAAAPALGQHLGAAQFAACVVSLQDAET